MGKTLNDHIGSIKNDNLDYYKKLEDDLKNKEDKLLSQKNDIGREEFDKKVQILSKEINNYRIKKDKFNKTLKKIKIDNTKKILNILNPIITKYVEENSIEIVLPKKNIIVGKKKLDITQSILILLNEEIKQIKF